MTIDITTNNIYVDEGTAQYNYSIDSISGYLITKENGVLILKLILDGNNYHTIPLNTGVVLNGVAFVDIASFKTLFKNNFTGNKPGADLAEVVIISGGYIYTGIAPIGSLQADAVWKINRETEVMPFITTWAGSGNFNQIMANYSLLTYA